MTLFAQGRLLKLGAEHPDSRVSIDVLAQMRAERNRVSGGG